MPEPLPAFDAIVLHRQISGENYIRLHLASAERGLTCIMARHSSRGKSHNLPDLFDSGEFHIDTASGGGLFLKEFRLDKRRMGLARRYESFQQACAFAEIFRKNLEHLEEPSEPVALLVKALDAFENGPRPEATLLKSLYLLARMEGFPVKEQWLGSLPASRRSDAASVLNLSLEEQIVDPHTIEQLLQSLKQWLRSVDFVL